MWSLSSLCVMLKWLCFCSEYSGLHATVVSTLPASAGLGSSAAFSVCLAAGFLSLVGAIGSQKLGRQDFKENPKGEPLHMNEARIGTCVAIPQFVQDIMSNERSLDSPVIWSAQELETINSWGLEAEKLIHGTPSGIDNSISTFGK